MNRNILIPRNIEGRKDKLRQDMIKLLSQEVIEGDLIINVVFMDIPLDLIKVKEIKGDVMFDSNISTNFIPSWLKDVKIYGYFDCSCNDLTNLENCPQYVDGTFYCSRNKLISLEGCPKFIGGDLICHDNSKILQLPEGVKLKGDFVNE